MKSIKRRLLITIVIGTVVIPIEFGVVVYAILYDAFRDDPAVQLWRVPLPLALAALLASLVVIGLAVHFIRAGLEPLNQFSGELRQIDAESLSQRVDTEALPVELRTTGETINALLKRLEVAFERERRTTGNIAHELRTPIAELRTLTEVAQRTPGDSELANTTVAEANAIAQQMQRLVTVLLQLARTHRTGDQADIETMQLAELVDAARQPWAVKAQRKQIDLQVDVPPDVSIAADRSAIETILSNLLANAVTHCPAGGRIAVTGSATRVAFENTNNGLTAADIPQLTEPFWRQDAARTDGTHAGLGLTLVADLCKACNYDLDLSLKDDWFRVSVKLGS